MRIISLLIRECFSCCYTTLENTLTCVSNNRIKVIMLARPSFTVTILKIQVWADWSFTSWNTFQTPLENMNSKEEIVVKAVSYVSYSFITIALTLASSYFCMTLQKMWLVYPLLWVNVALNNYKSIWMFTWIFTEIKL